MHSSARGCEIASFLLLPGECPGRPRDVPRAIERYCAECHNTDDWAGGLDLTTLDPAHVARRCGVVGEGRAQTARGHDAAAGQGTSVARGSRCDRFDAGNAARCAGVGGAAASATQPGVPAPAPVLHRLNRTEYANAIRDLFGMPVDVSGLLPPDDASEGFDNMASGLGISPALIQGYTSAAMKLSRAAVGDMTATETTAIYQAPEKLAQDQHLEGLPLGSRGGMRIEHDFPLDAEYHFSVRGNFCAGAAIAGLADATSRSTASACKVRTCATSACRVTAGRHVLTAALFETRGPPASTTSIRCTGRMPGSSGVEITGPFNATGLGDTGAGGASSAAVRSRRRKNAAAPRRSCVDIASRAFRAPQRPADLADIMRFYERGHDEGGFEAGIQQALSRILIDPRFLFRFEEEPARCRAGRAFQRQRCGARVAAVVLPLEQHSRRAAARPRGEEASCTGRKCSRRRSGACSPIRKAYALVENFAGQWLYLRELATVTPEVDGLRREPARGVHRGDPRAGRLGAHPGSSRDRAARPRTTPSSTSGWRRTTALPDVRGSHFRKVKLPAGSHRRGVLGQGSILTVTSTASRTSPVIRGSWILENLLGAPVPAPPPGVETNLDGDGTQVITTSVRAAPRSSPQESELRLVPQHDGSRWASRWRTSMPSAPGASAMAIPRSTPAACWRMARRSSGPRTSTAALMSHSELFITNVVEKLMTYALGRAVEYHDMPAVRAIVRQARREDLKFSALVLGVVQSEPFRHRTKAPQDAAPSKPCELRRPRVAESEGDSDGKLHHPKKHLSRRTVLRGAGAALALPLLESMVPGA